MHRFASSTGERSLRPFPRRRASRSWGASWRGSRREGTHFVARGRVSARSRPRPCSSSWPGLRPPTRSRRSSAARSGRRPPLGETRRAVDRPRPDGRRRRRRLPGRRPEHRPRGAVPRRGGGGRRRRAAPSRPSARRARGRPPRRAAGRGAPGRPGGVARREATGPARPLDDPPQPRRGRRRDVARPGPAARSGGRLPPEPRPLGRRPPLAAPPRRPRDGRRPRRARPRRRRGVPPRPHARSASRSARWARRRAPRAPRASPTSACGPAPSSPPGRSPGLAGGLEVLALTGRLYDPFTAGVGYSGIAAALLGGMTPLGGAASGVLFAALGAGSSALQRDAGVPSALASIVPALAVLGLLLARGGRTAESSR